MGKYTLVVTDTGNDIGTLTGQTLSLGVLSGSGPMGAGWTGVTFDNSTNVFTFTSNDGLGYVTDPLNTNVVTDTTPQLGGNLDLNGSDITGTGNINITGTITASSTITSNDLVVNGDFTVTGDLTVQGTTITVDSASAQNIVLGDNDKMTFGAGSDLQIYHDGSNSYVSEVGVGALRLQGTNLQLQSSAGVNYLQGINNDRVDIYHNGSVKLATTSTGIDVTGTVTADGLTVENAATNGVLIKAADNAETTYPLVIQNSADSLDFGLGAYGFDNTIGVSQGSDFKMNVGRDIYMRSDGKNYFRMDTGGDISFYEDTGTTAKFFWDASAESLGIGTTSPASFFSGGNQLVVGDGSGAQGLTIYAESTNHGQILFADGTTGNEAYRGILRYDHVTDSMQIMTAGASERMRIDSSGNVGIGTSSPDGNLTVGDTSTSGDISIRIKGDATSRGFLMFGDNGGAQLGDIMYDHSDNHMRFRVNNSEAMRIDSSGNVGIGTSTTTGGNTLLDLHKSGYGVGTQIRFANDHSTGYYVGLAGNTVGEGIIWNESNAGMLFGTNNSERMRIDSSGNLLVGKTAINSNVAGFEVDSDGKIAATRDASQVAIFNRLTDDGDIVTFRKDGTTVGSIGAKSGDIYIGTGDTGVRFNDGDNAVYAANTTTGSASDGNISLGVSAARFKDLYLSGGVYLGGTGSANKLDDYEEGNWIPVAAGDSSSGTASYSVQSGTYTKIGNMVYIMGRLGWTGHTGSGNLIINGLPFSSNNQYAFLGFSFRDYLTITAGKTAYAFVKPSAATVAFIEIGTGTSATAGVAMDTDVVDVSFSGFYTTNA